MRNRIKLRNKLTKRVRVTKTVKEALYATVCDNCGKVHQMREFCNDDYLGKLRGTFDRCANDRNGRGLGNGFSCYVCSFACAHEIMTGGWKRLKDYKPFVKVDATLARAELKITSYVVGEDDLTAEWDIGVLP